MVPESAREWPEKGFPDIRKLSQSVFGVILAQFPGKVCRTHNTYIQTMSLDEEININVWHALA